MREKMDSFLKYRKVAGGLSCIDGAYQMASPGDTLEFLTIIASIGEGWDHVSVSLVDRCPTWPEMEYVRSLFFLTTETVMQLHVPQSQHINYQEFCLHMWRPQNEEILRPPAWMVGPNK